MAKQGLFNSSQSRSEAFGEIDRRQKELRERIDREVPLEAAYTLFASELGLDATPHENGGNRFYKSPKSLSGDGTASLHVDEATRRWFDHSNPDSDKRRKSGYGVVSLAYYLGAGSRHSTTELLRILGQHLGTAYVFNPNVVHDRPAAREGVTASSSDYRIVREIRNRDNIRFFEERGIPETLLKKYCSACLETVTYSDGTKKTYESVAFPMSSGGYALRSAGGVKRNTKGFPADITVIGPDGLTHSPEEGAGSRRLLVFEGFSDFLSYCMWKNERNIRDGRPADLNPSCDCVVLNSTSNLSKTFPLLGRYDDVRVFNDNDNGGRGMVAEMAMRRSEDRGVPVVFTSGEMDFIREKVFAYLDRVESAEREAVAAGKGGDLSLTKAEAERVAAARRNAVSRFNIGSRTADFDELALQRFMDSLTPDNVLSLCTRHNLTPYRNTVILHRVTASSSGGLVVCGDFAKAVGVTSMAQIYYPEVDDLNDRWKQKWNGGLREAWEKLQKSSRETTDNKKENTMENNENRNKFPFEAAGTVTDRQVAEFKDRMKLSVWKQIQDELIGARDEHRTPEERQSPDLWYRRNMDIFIDECRKYYGPSPLSAMTRGGYTAVPVRCEAKHVKGFHLINFDLRDPGQPDWYVFSVPVKSEDVKVNDRDGNFLYYEKAPKSWVKQDPTDPILYGKGRNGHFFNEAAGAELRATGRLHYPIDPGTLEPFTDHTDAEGNVYTLDDKGDLLKNGKLHCKEDDAHIVSVSRWDPNLVIGMRLKEVKQYVARLPLYETEGERFNFSKDDISVLVHGGDLSLRAGDRDICVHYDVDAGQVKQGESYESIRIREGVEKNNALLKSKTLGTGEGEYPKKGI